MPWRARVGVLSPCVCEHACVRVWECSECVGVCVYVQVCTLWQTRVPCRLCVKVGTETDWIRAGCFWSLGVYPPHTVHTDTNAPLKHWHRAYQGKRAQRPPIPYPVFCIYLQVWLNMKYVVDLFLRWNSGMCCFQVWGRSNGPLYTMGLLWGVPISMVQRGSPLGGRLMPSLWIEANSSLHRDLLELQILVWLWDTWTDGPDTEHFAGRSSDHAAPPPRA